MPGQSLTHYMPHSEAIGFDLPTLKRVDGVAILPYALHSRKPAKIVWKFIVSSFPEPNTALPDPMCFFSSCSPWRRSTCSLCRGRGRGHLPADVTAHTETSLAPLCCYSTALASWQGNCCGGQRNQ
eukprot:4726059-Amphidinium_carterae.1